MGGANASASLPLQMQGGRVAQELSVIAVHGAAGEEAGEEEEGGKKKRRGGGGRAAGGVAENPHPAGRRGWSRGFRRGAGAGQQ